MAKAIKFNLFLDGKPVRNLDDLRDNFNIEDILSAYRNGSLKRWLDVREMTTELAALEKISGDDVKVAMELCHIFRGNCSKQELESAVYPFEFKQKEAAKLQQYEDLKKQKAEIIRAYHGGYEKLLKDISTKGEDYPFIKAALREIFEKYLGLFKLNVRWFYDQFIFDFPLVILGVLANSDLRPLLISDYNGASLSKDHVFADNMENIFLDITKKDRALSSFLERYRSGIDQPHIRTVSSQEECDELKSRNRPVYLLNGTASEATSSVVAPERLPSGNFTYIAKGFSYPSHIKSFSGQTEGYWKDIQPKGKIFLVIEMGKGDFIRNAGKNGEELNAEAVNGKFPILEGIDYKSNNERNTLFYMEV